MLNKKKDFFFVVLAFGPFLSNFLLVLFIPLQGSQQLRSKGPSDHPVTRKLLLASGGICIWPLVLWSHLLGILSIILHVIKANRHSKKSNCLLEILSCDLIFPLMSSISLSRLLINDHSQKCFLPPQGTSCGRRREKHLEQWDVDFEAGRDQDWKLEHVSFQCNWYLQLFSVKWP